MRPFIFTGIVVAAAGLAIAASGKSELFEVTYDLSARRPAEFYDFNIALLTHLQKPIKLDVKVAARDLDRKDGWLQSSYYITPDELRGVEVRVPQAAIWDADNGTFRVRGTFKVSEVMSHRQGQVSLHLLPPA